MVKDYSDSERGYPLLPHRLLFRINNKGSFMCTIPVVEHWLERYKQWIQRDFSSDSNCDEFASKIQFKGNILLPFQFEPAFTAAEIQAKKDLVLVPLSLISSYVTELDEQPAH